MAVFHSRKNTLILGFILLVVMLGYGIAGFGLRSDAIDLCPILERTRRPNRAQAGTESCIRTPYERSETNRKQLRCPRPSREVAS